MAREWCAQATTPTTPAVKALAALFDAHPDDAAFTETTRWLEPHG